MNLQALFVENDSRQFESLSKELKDANWIVERASHKEEALQRLRNLDEKKVHIDVVAVDLGLPPDPDNVTVGIELIQAIRNMDVFQELPILAYTSQSHIPSVHYAYIVRRFLAMQVSFLYLRPLENNAFSTLLKYVSHGFVFLSPGPAGYLSDAVPDRPDPLPEDIWDTLEALSRGLTHPEAARELNISAETIRSRLDKARQILIDRGDLLFDAHNEEIYNWFRKHRVRYVRDRNIDKPAKKEPRNSPWYP